MRSKILCSLIWGVSKLPLAVLYLFSDISWLVVYYVIRYRRKVVRMNLMHAFPEKSLEEVIRIEKKFYRHLCDLFVESYHLAVSYTHLRAHETSV